MESTQILDKVLEERKSAKLITRGSMVEGVFGVGAIVLAVIGLAGAFPLMMLSVSTIALGVALIIEAGAVMGIFSSIVQDVEEAKSDFNIPLSGISVESLAGIAGIALGVLSLIGIKSMLLIPIAITCFGVAIAFSAGSIGLIDSLIAGRSSKNQIIQNVLISMSAAAADIRTLIGLGSITLGILAIIGYHTYALSFIGILSIGGVLFLESLPMNSGILGIFRR
jgi:hypothetical protein